MLPGLEYFAKSLKITEGHSKLHCWMFHCTISEIFSIR